MQGILIKCLNSTIRCSHINTVRHVGVYKRTSLNLLSRDLLNEVKTNLLQQQQSDSITTTDWQQTRQNLIDNYKHINQYNIDAVILGVCNEAQHLPLAKAYVQFLRDEGVEPNAASLGRLLRVYNAAYHEYGKLSASEEQEILDIVSVLKQKYPIMDAITCEHLIHGLVATNQWRQAMEYLEMSKLASAPSLAAYTELTLKAFTSLDLELGWSLLEDMVEQRKQPKCEVYIAYLNSIANDHMQFLFNFEKLLQFVEKHELILTAQVVDCITSLAQKYPDLLSAAPTQLSNFGKCAVCGIFMQNIALSDAEFRQLRDSFLEKVLIRNDVFQKSTPEEVDNFKRYVAKTMPWDCVIDGLNVAYSMGNKKSPTVLAKSLVTFVKYFVKQDKRVLVLGRKHLNKWPKDIMRYVHQNADIFLTNNLSHDDPFLLYATLKSGPATDFFSRDLMRGHAHLLGPELKSIFRRWQQQHQFSLVTQTDCGKFIIKEPIRHRIYAHKVQNTLHLPYKQNYSANPAESFEISDKWLCIQFQNKEL